jgi:hypothetical protein
MQSNPENANENCPGIEDKNAGKSNACAGFVKIILGCPN